MRWIFATLLALCLTTIVCAQDIPNITLPTDTPKATGPDWEKIIDRVGYYFLAALTAVLSFIAQYRAGTAVKKADEAKQLVEESRKEDKVEVEKQTQAIKHVVENVTSQQTETMLLAKIAEKPVAVIPGGVPTVGTPPPK